MESEILKLPAELQHRTIELPAPTAWPIVMAFGLTLVFAGLVTNASVSILGAILTIAGCVGWFRDVLPHEAAGPLGALHGPPSAPVRPLSPGVTKNDFKSHETTGHLGPVIPGGGPVGR